MNSAKSYKLIILLTAFVLALVAAFCSMSVSTVKAATAADPDDYFSITANETVVDRNLRFADDNVVVTVQDGDVLTIDRKLVINDFEMKIVAPDFTKFEKITFKFASDSYYVNGNKNADGKFDTEIVNAFEITSAIDTLKVEVVDGVVSFNGNPVSDKYYRIDAVDMATAKISIEFDLVSGADSADFSIVSIDQKASDADGKYKQTFELDETTEALTKKAYPRVSLNDEVFTRTKDDNGTITSKLVVGEEDKKTFTLNVHSLLGDVTASSVYLAKDKNNETSSIWLNKADKPKTVMFTESSAADTFCIVYSDIKENDVLETYEVEVLEYNDNENAYDDEDAPYYVYDKEAVEAFTAALAKAVKDEEGKSIPLGTKLELPSLADLVFDNVKPYADLSATVYYYNQTSSTSSDMSFTVGKSGDYKFYVAFSDGKNSMESKDFYEKDEEDANEIISDKYFDYVFDFHMIDDADILIEKSSVEGVGFKGITYTASKFKIDAEGCTTTYTLYYSADEDADVDDDDAWVEIPAASKITDTSYNENGLTYDAVKAIAYDGELTFTPTKLGAYKIVCSAASTYTTRGASEDTVVRITESAKVVKLPNYWLRDNAWSVVFLSIGTLSLIGIIVLLCIKPKDETESD